MSTTARPDFVEDEHLEYLDDLRESGITNRYEAGTLFIKDFPMSYEDVNATVYYWMTNFDERRGA